LSTYFDTDTEYDVKARDVAIQNQT
jgi:hypothetical protein